MNKERGRGFGETREKIKKIQEVSFKDEWNWEFTAEIKKDERVMKILLSFRSATFS